MTDIERMTDQELEAEYDEIQDHGCTYEGDCTSCERQGAMEREIDARELWNSDDDRVRESVGNYR